MPEVPSINGKIHHLSAKIKAVFAQILPHSLLAAKKLLRQLGHPAALEKP
jgi:hypothetical protein